MTIDKFIDEVKKLGIELSLYQLDQFDTYFTLLTETNKVMNLTAITEKEEVYEKHFYDCLLCLKVFKFSNQNICDIGAGAGFPSIPLKIVYPDLQITIVDSLDKRIKFLNQLFTSLNLSNVKAISQRAEEFAQTNFETYDLVMARAVARLNILDELCIPLVKLNGYFLALKGKQGLIEHEEARTGLQLLGVETAKIEKYNLISDESIRYLLLYKKTKNTNKKYPRNFGQIKKNPL